MIVFLVFILAAFLVFFDLLQPTYTDLQNKKGTEASSENFLASEQQAVAQAKKLIGQYESESQAESNLALAMPTGPDVAAALAEIYGIAQDSGVTVQNVQVGAPTVQLANQAQSGNVTSSAGQVQIVKPLGTFPLQVIALGSYENVKNFLSQLETNIRIFDLTMLSMQPTPGAIPGVKTATASDFFTYNLTITTYYQTP